MTFKPAHKNTENPPGQIRNDITLDDYIERKTQAITDKPSSKKITFEEWWDTNYGGNEDRFEHYDAEWFFHMGIAWKAGQENK